MMMLIVPVWIKQKNPWGLYDKMTEKDTSDGER